MATLIQTMCFLQVHVSIRTPGNVFIIFEQGIVFIFSVACKEHVSSSKPRAVYM